jgi:hypothetical protein
MKWTDLPLHPRSRDLRQFSAGWLVFFVAWGAHRWLGHGPRALGVALCLLGVVVGGLGLFKPGAVRWLFLSWMVLVFPIGWLVSQVVLAVMFYGIITPVALLFRLGRRDLLCRKPALDRPSYWTPKTTPEDVRRYLRQY